MLATCHSILIDKASLLNKMLLKALTQMQLIKTTASTKIVLVFTLKQTNRLKVNKKC